MSKYLDELIAAGEHQTQDFKFAISDSRKIARTLAAFANTDGGRLLVGVKDNGHIVGIASDEEYYMIEAAANIYCKPTVKFETRIWKKDGKTVLEVIVSKSENKPHKAPFHTGEYKAFIRVNDKNILANTILLKVWARQKKEQGTFLKYSETESKLIEYLNKYDAITLSGFQRMMGIKRKIAEATLINLISMDILKMELDEMKCVYKLK